jgi:hypothetical protein
MKIHGSGQLGCKIAESERASLMAKQWWQFSTSITFGAFDDHPGGQWALGIECVVMTASSSRVQLRVEKQNDCPNAVARPSLPVRVRRMAIVEILTFVHRPGNVPVVNLSSGRSAGS